MSKYLDVIRDKITKKEKKDAFIILGTALAATVLAKHFTKNKSNDFTEENFLFEKEGPDYLLSELDEDEQDSNDFDYLDKPEPQFDPFSNSN